MEDFLGIGILLVAGFIGLISFAIWIFALIDVIRSDFRGDNDKVIWLLVVVLAGILGAIIYFIVGRKNKV